MNITTTTTRSQTRSCPHGTDAGPNPVRAFIERTMRSVDARWHFLRVGRSCGHHDRHIICTSHQQHLLLLPLLHLELSSAGPETDRVNRLVHECVSLMCSSLVALLDGRYKCKNCPASHFGGLPGGVGLSVGWSPCCCPHVR